MTNEELKQGQSLDGILATGAISTLPITYYPLKRLAANSNKLS
jgi:hypothetical protein